MNATTADSLKVLMVDDDEDQLSLVARLLRVEGFEVQTTSSPVGVPTLARKFDPDIVLLDVNIPGISGDRLLTLLKKDHDGHARYIFFSSIDAERLRTLASTVHADGWIQKTFDGQVLGAELRRLCTD